MSPKDKTNNLAVVENSLIGKAKTARLLETDIKLDFLPFRWSPRRGIFASVSKEELASLVEVARWAPSSYNEQEWRYVLELKGQVGYDELLACLNPANQEWAKEWPVLGVLIAKTTFTHNGHTNRSAKFDCGISMGFLLAEATARGFACHLMAGFNGDKIREFYCLSDEFDPVCCFTIGRFVDSDDQISSRKQLNEILFWGKDEWLERGRGKCT